jgi:predicted nucleic acid-binding protein
MARHSQRGGLPIAVIDTTLLTRLVGLEIAQFLPFLFKQVLIPPEVKREAYKAPHKGKRRLRKLVAEMTGFFVDCYEADELVKSYLKADLGEGEAAAIAQADYRQSAVLMDEKKGSKRAETMQLTVIRTLNVLNMLKDAGVIAEVKPYYDKLGKTGFYLEEKVRRRLLSEAGEE